MLVSGVLIISAGNSASASAPITQSFVSIVSVSEVEVSPPEIDEESIEKLVSLNRVFGPLLYNDSAVVEGVCHATGEKEKAMVNQTVYDMYGRRILDSKGDYFVGENLAEYEVKINGIKYNQKGEIEVKSTLTVTFDGEIRVDDCVTLCAPSTHSSFGYIITKAEIK